MQLILALAIVGVAIAAMGSGFLTNTINLQQVQKLGVGETTLDSPVTTAQIDFNIGRATDSPTTLVHARNVIDECIIHTQSNIPRLSTIICKLTDINNNVVIEGCKVLTNAFGLPVSFRTVVPIVDTTFPFQNDVTNIHDVLLVVKGPSVTGALPTCP